MRWSVQLCARIFKISDSLQKLTQQFVIIHTTSKRGSGAQGQNRTADTRIFNPQAQLTFLFNINVLSLPVAANWRRQAHIALPKNGITLPFLGITC
jgi:hypothetical protein